jgi:nucleotide-binding universal stress UspA family protein
MAAWKRICCAIDFSAASQAAMDAAADLARRFGADLMLAHAVVGTAPPESFPLGADEALVELEPLMARWRAAAARRADRPVSSTVLVGDAADEIVRHARGHACDLVVLGTRGRAGPAGLLADSVAERVVRHAPCAVLVVRAAPAREPARRAAALERVPV